LSHLFSTADFRVTVAALAVAVGIILFLACANAANLLLVRAENRGREFVIRAAVGAGRGRLIRQLLTESVILGALAGTAGLLLAFWVIRILSVHLPAELPRLREIGLDDRAFGFALLLSLATGILFGLMPAWRVARAGTSEMLRNAGHGYTLGRERRLFQRGLIVAQIALTLVLLFSMGLMFQSVSRFLHVEPGYDPTNLLGFMVTHWNTDPPERDARLDRLRDAFKALPGVTSVAVSTTGLRREIELGGNAAPIPIHHTLVRVRDSDYFRTWRIPLKRGRTFQSADATGSVVIVSESLAKRLWPGEEAVGQWFQPTSKAERCEVVGVVGDVTDDPERGPQLAYYEPYEKAGERSQCSYFTLRTATDVSSLIPAVRKTLWQLDPMTIPPEMMLPQARFAALVQPRETFLRFLSASGAVSLVLAVIGIYGVLAHLVACRTHEIGVRMALGATATSVLTMALRQGATLIVIGLSAGTLAAFLTARFIQSKLFGVGTTDPTTLVGVALLLTAAALTACYVPARRASKVDPIVSLRYE
jgi:putative ABC transport system permease protein